MVRDNLIEVLIKKIVLNTTNGFGLDLLRIKYTCLFAVIKLRKHNRFICL